MSRNHPKVHIQDPSFLTRALCGRDWREAKGGRAASSTDPPVVHDDASGSVNLATCRVCLLTFRRRLGRSNV